MKIRLSPDVLKSLQNIKRKDHKLLAQIHKQLKLFQSNPRHQSLRLHKLTGKLHNRWSISINRSVRMIYISLNENEFYFIALGTHDEVYK